MKSQKNGWWRGFELPIACYHDMSSTIELSPLLWFRFINAMLHSQYYQAAASTLLSITGIMILTRGTLSTYVSTKAKLCRHWGFHFILTFACGARARARSFNSNVVRRRSCCPELNREGDSCFMWRIDWKTTMMCSTTFSVWPLWRLLVSNGRTLSYLFPGRSIGLKFTRRI